MRAAAVQLNSTDDLDRNVEAAERLVREAAADGAELVVLPEKWTVLGGSEALWAAAQELEGEVLGAVRAWARELGVDLVAGSFAEKVEGEAKLFNTSALIDREGEIVATYRKIHMFDVDVGGVAYRESDAQEPGQEIVLGEVGNVPIGLTVCYDLRYPELYRILALRGARVIAVPAAFTRPTGEAHWEVLLRARAIEDQVFMVAANQFGQAPPHYDSHGHSMIVDPWGVVLARAGREEGVVAAELDFDRQDELRAELPSLANRRPGAYSWPDAIEVS